MIYTDENRGHVQSPRAAQIIEFTGMKYGNCTPTDIDGLIEKDNEAFVFFELKYREAEMPHGQKTALMRLVDNLELAGKKSVLFVARHEVDNPSETVTAANASVTDIYYCGKWVRCRKEPLDEMVGRFLEWATR